MKLRTILSAMAIGLALTACSSKNVSHDATNLPSKARDLISQNFTSAISLVEEEKNFGKVTEYEVTLTDGSEITFDHAGEWKSIDTPNNVPVPVGLVPTAIANYVASKHAGAYIVGIEKEKKGFEVELSNGVEMNFNTFGNFVSYD